MASQSGIHVIAAAGNDFTDACGFSPASAAKTISVGMTDMSDERDYFSNYGDCVTLYAPGDDITSLWYKDKDYLATASGTSMAAAHVSGIAALYRSDPTYATLSPSELKKTLISHAISFKVGNVPAGPNYLANFVKLLQ